MHFETDFGDDDIEVDETALRDGERAEAEYNQTLDSSKIFMSDGVDTGDTKKRKAAPRKRKAASTGAAPRKPDKIKAMRKKHKNQTAAAAFEVIDATIDAYGDSTHQEAFKEATDAEQQCKETMLEIRRVCRLSAKATTQQKECAALMKNLKKDEKSELLVGAAIVIERLNGELKKQTEKLDALAALFAKNSSRIVSLTRQKQAADVSTLASRSAAVAPSNATHVESQLAVHQGQFHQINEPLMALRTGPTGSLALTMSTKPSTLLGSLETNKRYLDVSLARTVPIQTQSTALVQRRVAASQRVQKERTKMENFAGVQIMPEFTALALPVPPARLLADVASVD
jgi:hypothetical protein